MNDITIALVAHDNKKIDMVEWANNNKETLKEYKLLGTEGTARRINQVTGLQIENIGHGPNGGDIHIAYNILEKNIDLLVFFVDTKKAHGHEHDIQSLIRTCATADIPFALNRATANSLIKSKIVKYEKN